MDAASTPRSYSSHVDISLRYKVDTQTRTIFLQLSHLVRIASIEEASRGVQSANGRTHWSGCWRLVRLQLHSVLALMTSGGLHGHRYHDESPLTVYSHLSLKAPSSSDITIPTLLTAAFSSSSHTGPENYEPRRREHELCRVSFFLVPHVAPLILFPIHPRMHLGSQTS